MVEEQSLQLHKHIYQILMALAFAGVLIALTAQGAKRGLLQHEQQIKNIQKALFLKKASVANL